MIRGSMTVDRTERLDADELLRHPWLTVNQDGQPPGEHSESSVAATDDPIPNLVTAVCLDKDWGRPAEATPPSRAARSASVLRASQSDLSRRVPTCRDSEDADATTAAEGTPPTSATIQSATALNCLRPDPETTASARVGSGLSLATVVPEGTPPPPKKGNAGQADRKARCASEHSQTDLAEDVDGPVFSLLVHGDQVAPSCSVGPEPVPQPPQDRHNIQQQPPQPQPQQQPQQQHHHPGPEPEPEPEQDPSSSDDEQFEECRLEF
jgi:hypothetical protein